MPELAFPDHAVWQELGGAQLPVGAQIFPTSLGWPATASG
jgi:hypothetical protein